MGHLLRLLRRSSATEGVTEFRGKKNSDISSGSLPGQAIELAALRETG